MEPPVGIEPTTCSLRETRPTAPNALPAQIAHRIAQNAQDAPAEPGTRSTTRSTDRSGQNHSQLTEGSRATVGIGNSVFAADAPYAA